MADPVPCCDESRELADLLTAARLHAARWKALAKRLKGEATADAHAYWDKTVLFMEKQLSRMQDENVALKARVGELEAACNRRRTVLPDPGPVAPMTTTTNRTTQLEERLLELHEGGCDGCGGCVLIRKAAAIGAELAFEEAAGAADAVTITDFRKYGMGVYAERIRRLSKEVARGER